MPTILQSVTIIILICLSTICCAQVDTLLLNNNWQFREATSTSWQIAQVPGTVQEDLIRLGQLPDPFMGTNEDSLLWIETKDWVYKSTFKLSQEQLKKEHHTMIFHGLDTYAEVFLNGQRILTADNMFRRWEIKVAQQLQVENELKIYFHSPIKKGKALMESLPYRLPAGNDAGKFKVAPVVRKAAFHFGWDWGPRIVTSGIWRPVQLLSYDGARIIDVQISDEVEYGIFQAKPGIADSLIGRSYASLNAEVILEGDPLWSFVNCWHGDYSNWSAGSELTRAMNFIIVDPELWWPNGLGKQKIYTLHCQLGENGHSYTSKKIGLRKAELIHQADSLGTSFFFEINDRPVFAKGANYIPQRHLTNGLTKNDYRKLLTTAAQSNMNMIRVWGGGIYEEDYFYELCDSLGLMVWQDFMCSNTIYPIDTTFSQNLLDEVKDNVKRLGHHPSIVHWCGNNEIDVAWHNWGWQKEYEISEHHQKLLYDNYEFLFKREIPKILKSLLPKANYSHTSPISNWGTAENFNHASMHYWGVFHGEDPFEDYTKNVGRFNSEYGFQTFPNINVIEDHFMPALFDLEDPLLAHRQKSYKGNRLIYKHISDYYPEPQSLLELSYLSQLTQAKGISMAIQAHRLDQPRCMGSLYWQLNDCWPAVSWSSLDYNGQWKALHYKVKEDFRPVTCFLDTLDDKMQLVFINELSHPEKLNCTISDLDGTVLHKGEFIISKMGEVHKNLKSIVYEDLAAIRVIIESDSGETSRIHWLDSAVVTLEKPRLKMHINNSKLTLKSQNLIKDLYLFSKEGYHFSNNFFDLLPGKTYEIELSHPENKLPHISKIRYISINNLVNIED